MRLISTAHIFQGLSVYETWENYVQKTHEITWCGCIGRFESIKVSSLGIKKLHREKMMVDVTPHIFS